MNSYEMIILILLFHEYDFMNLNSQYEFITENRGEFNILNSRYFEFGNMLYKFVLLLMNSKES